MSTPRWLSPAEQRAWRAYIESSKVLFDALDRQLQRDADMPHAYYEILVALSEADARSMRMSELAERTLSSRGMVIETDASGAPVRVAGACLDVTDARQTEAQLQDSKRAVVRDLSTPILQVRAGLLIVPVVGDLDGERARRLANELLARIRATRARAVVVDLTGVPAFEPSVAMPLVQAVESARLMGARTIVTGLSADIAAALVAQELDLSAITVAGDLQAGIEVAVGLLD